MGHTVFWRVDRIALVLDDAALSVQTAELPLDKVVVEGVGIGGDKAASPVNAAAHALHVMDHDSRKEVQPLLSLPGAASHIKLRCRNPQPPRLLLNLS